MEIWQIIVVALGPTGAAWMGVKAGLNGMRERQKGMDVKLDRIEDQLHRNTNRLTALETEIRK